MSSVMPATTIYVAPDWGMALRISGALEAEFGRVRVVGGYQSGHFHGTIFAVESDRFPASWSGRVLAMDEGPTASGGAARLRPHPDPDFERLILSVVASRLAPPSAAKEAAR